MSPLNKIIIATLICNLLIIVGVGHGVAPIGLLEPFYVVQAFNGEIPLTLLGNYGDRVYASVMLSIPGQLIFIAACLLKGRLKLILTWAGLTILISALLFLTVDFSSGTIELYSLIFAVPFIYAVIRLINLLLQPRILQKV